MKNSARTYHHEHLFPSSMGSNQIYSIRMCVSLSLSLSVCLCLDYNNFFQKCSFAYVMQNAMCKTLKLANVLSFASLSEAGVHCIAFSESEVSKVTHLNYPSPSKSSQIQWSFSVDFRYQSFTFAIFYVWQ